MAEPQISVVVPTRGRPERLRALVESLRTQTMAADLFELVIVDDGSEPPLDSHRAGIEGLRNARLLRHEQAQGPGAARNSGWQVARAPVVAFTDDDCRADPRWLAGLMARSRAGDGLVIQGRTEPDPDETDRLGPFSLTREVRGPDYVFETCNIAYPRELLARLGGFDETYRRCAEDVDLGWRALSAGARLEFAHDALVNHAVTQPRMIELMRHAWRQLDNVRAIKAHPGLRAMLKGGVFWKASHAPLLALIVGLALATVDRRTALAVPGAVWYAGHYRNRYAGAGIPPERVPGLMARHLVIDATEVVTMLAGSVRHRALVL